MKFKWHANAGESWSHSYNGDVFAFFVFVKILWEALRYRHKFPRCRKRISCENSKSTKLFICSRDKRGHNVPGYAKKNIKISKILFFPVQIVIYLHQLSNAIIHLFILSLFKWKWSYLISAFDPKQYFISYMSILNLHNCTIHISFEYGDLLAQICHFNCGIYFESQQRFYFLKIPSYFRLWGKRNSNMKNYSIFFLW